MLNVMLETMLEVDLLKAEWERKKLRKRQEERISRAREKGSVFGRKKNDSYREGVKELYSRTRNKDAENYITVKEAAEIIGCSKKTFYLLVDEIFGKI